MPYELRNGTEIWSKSGGKWHLKQRCTSAQNAHIVMSNLEKLEKHPNAKVFDEAKKKRKRRKPEPGLGVM